MMTVKGTVHGIPETVAAFGQIPSLLRQAAEAAMRESLELVSALARSEYLSGPYPHRLQPRTGRLRASLRRGDRDNIFTVESQGTKVRGTLGTTTVYAGLHEFGGIIRPKHGQYLAIPTDEAKTATGIVKAEFNRPLRTIPGLFLQRSQSGSLYAARSRGRRGRLQVLFHLVRQVHIFPRPFLNTGLNRSRPAIEQTFATCLQLVVDRLQQTFDRIRGRAA